MEGERNPRQVTKIMACQLIMASEYLLKNQQQDDINATGKRESCMHEDHKVPWKVIKVWPFRKNGLKLGLFTFRLSIIFNEKTTEALKNRLDSFTLWWIPDTA